MSITAASGSSGVGDFPIAGKIVVITGGGSGIGLALSKLCQSHGARVLIGDLKLTPDGQAFVDSSKDVRFRTCDVTVWSDLKDLITASVTEFGSVPDVYVPNAGVFVPPWSNFWDDNEESSYKTNAINVDHPIKFTRLAMRALIGAEKKGVVCMLGSVAGIHGSYTAALYCASKHAIIGFTKSLGPADQQEGVKVVAICPAVVASPLWTDRADDRASEFHYDKAPKLSPEDTAETMLRLITEGKYEGGTIVLKHPHEEKVIFNNEIKAADPGIPKTEPMEYTKSVLAKERGRPWGS